jgi:hypothetical protein
MYASIEPFGFHIEDARMAMIASTVANAAGAKTKAEDFLLGEPSPADEVDDPAARLAAALRVQLPPRPEADIDPPPRQD